MILTSCLIAFAFVNAAQGQTSPESDQAEAVIQKAIQQLGGDKYLKATSQIGRGRFSAVGGSAGRGLGFRERQPASAKAGGAGP